MERRDRREDRVFQLPSEQEPGRGGRWRGGGDEGCRARGRRAKAPRPGPGRARESCGPGPEQQTRRDPGPDSVGEAPALERVEREPTVACSLVSRTAERSAPHVSGGRS